ncbi:MAG: hypothetical protein CBB68_01165 [Rhodospirillaceae bacterium TMED8]|nr:hypothetical protein [Magnetovibrio sp.]OUT53165.1 MAG: hypothetical protein CBB68_01165 [Rhodospirillaceae bacterium TMED8]
MLSRRLITIFCLTFTIWFSATNHPLHAFPFGRIAQEIMSLYAPNPSNKAQTRNKPFEVTIPPGILSRAITHTGRYRDCDRDKRRTEIKPSLEDSCQSEASQAPE